jgi:MerR family copper efflux transcriptional regulator
LLDFDVGLRYVLNNTILDTGGHLADSTMHIGKLAERAGTTTRTVRYYEEMGLIEPCHRTTGGFRCYANEQLTQLMMILSLKELGFDLEKIKVILKMRGQGGTAGTLAASVLEDLHSRLDELNDQIAELEEVKGKVEKTITTLCHCLPCELRLEERLCDECERLKAQPHNSVPFFHTIQAN